MSTYFATPLSIVSLAYTKAQWYVKAVFIDG